MEKSRIRKKRIKENPTQWNSCYFASISLLHYLTWFYNLCTGLSGNDPVINKIKIKQKQITSLDQWHLSPLQSTSIEILYTCQHCFKQFPNSSFGGCHQLPHHILLNPIQSLKILTLKKARNHREPNENCRRVSDRDRWGWCIAKTTVWIVKNW